MVDIARKPGGVVADCSVESTQLLGLRVGCRVTELARLPRIVGAHVRNVEVAGAVVAWVVFDSCTFENVTGPTLILSALHVRTTLVGNFGRVMLRDVVLPEGDRERFADLRRQFYASGAWALDISRAEFLEFDCRHIPGELIVRNDE